jgi:uncharacterized membrane protein
MRRRSREEFSMLTWRTAGLAVVFLWFMGGGVTHFTNPDFFVSIMPPYIGFQLEIVYFSGLLEVIGAIGILLPQWRTRAGNGLFLLTIFVTPANVYMWRNPDLFPDVSETFLSVRLLIQVLLLACIWFSTRAPAASSDDEDTEAAMG